MTTFETLARNHTNREENIIIDFQHNDFSKVIGTASKITLKVAIGAID